MNLADRLNQRRGDIKQANAVLRRARHLYVLFTHKAIIADETTYTLNLVAERMKKCGMYANPTPTRSVRYSILRMMFKISRPEAGKRGWHRWCHDNRWTLCYWERAPKLEAVA